MKEGLFVVATWKKHRENQRDILSRCQDKGTVLMQRHRIYIQTLVRRINHSIELKYVSVIEILKVFRLGFYVFQNITYV